MSDTALDLDVTNIPSPHWAETLLDHIADAKAKSDGTDLFDFARMIGNALEVDVCSIYRFEAATEELVLAATVGLRWQSVGLIRMKRSEGLVGLVAETGDSVMIQDAQTHPRFKYFEEAGEDPFHSFLGLPLVDDDKLLGVLVVQTMEQKLFTGDEIGLLDLAADEIATCLH